MDPLFDAINNNDVTASKVLLASGRGDVRARDESGRTPLLFAVMEGKKELAQLLLSFGSEINKVDFKARCALHFACLNNDIELAEILISNGAKMDITDETGHTPLTVALTQLGQDSQIVKLLMTTSSEKKKQLQPYIWCLVGNIVEKRIFGEKKEVRRGTKKFSPNTKVYCFPPLWGDGYEDIQVIGKLKNRRNLGIIITSSKYITNWRLQKVFQPYIVKVMQERGGWDATDESKKEIEDMLTWLPSRTVHIEDSNFNRS